MTDDPRANSTVYLRQEQVIAALRSHVNMTTRELSQIIGTFPSNLTGAIDSLMKDGVIRASGKRECTVTGHYVRALEFIFKKPVDESDGSETREQTHTADL